MIFKLISRCFFIYFIFCGKWNLAQSVDSTQSSTDATITDISFQDPANNDATAITHTATASTPPSSGAFIPAPTIAQPVAASSPIAGAPISVPIAGTPIAGPINLGSHSVTLPMTAGVSLGTPINMAAQPATIPMTATPVVGAQPIAAPFTATPVTISLTPGAPIQSPTPITIGAQGGAHISASSQVLAAPFTAAPHVTPTNISAGSQAIVTPINAANQQPSPPPKPLNKVTIDIRVKESTAFIKYRRDEPEKTDIWYAIDGNIINEIQVNGVKRWPPDNETKECKKVLFIAKETDKKPTLKVLYEDESEAFDPDNPPSISTNSSLVITDDTSSLSVQTSVADGTSISSVPDPTSVNNEEQVVTQPAEESTQHTFIPATPSSVNFTQIFVDPTQSLQTPEITPGQTITTTSITPESQDQASSWTTPTHQPSGFTIPLETDQSQPSVSEEIPSGLPASSSIFGPAQVDHSAQPSQPPQMSYSHYDGKAYTDISLEDEEGDDDSDVPSHGFHVEEIYGYDPDDDDDGYQRVPLTDYVSNLGHRVGNLERRMDPVEDKIELLSRIIDYQHQILEFRELVGKKSAFDVDFGRHGQFGADMFRPATSQMSKELAVTEHPSDVKLLVIDPNDATKFVDLDTNKYKVKQEGDEIHYLLDEGVECKLVTYQAKSVWSHRNSDPHPIGVVFYPDDDKVVVDFEDAFVMYVKKGELSETIPLNPELTDMVGEGLTEIDPNNTESHDENNEPSDIQESR
ncbi:conserved hypothetical protein [Theileria orientalis strain Shintoku]|uniref:Uncharacterized protein n=1 Tax=Theileria orientalis strain Shintoku TaxID=869250 RepID=J7M4S1_THEOR|nr:conserved hypothetical protein [Theileria orientalis strain Shintoku]BAM42460.1 conserved hypothetical protein [Theileria orientalis strain Shintoku]|eukprot:XP_009692761.1 conserved hypothetical protein [Theileria orientalis strain Shintoku]